MILNEKSNSKTTTSASLTKKITLNTFSIILFMKCLALYNISAKANSYYNEKKTKQKNPQTNKKKVKNSAIEHSEVHQDDVQW